ITPSTTPASSVATTHGTHDLKTAGRASTTAATETPRFSAKIVAIHSLYTPAGGQTSRARDALLAVRERPGLTALWANHDLIGSAWRTRADGMANFARTRRHRYRRPYRQDPPLAADR